MNPIVGIRYKSATRENYDLCIDCEAKSGHMDIFFKIKRPEDFDQFQKDLKKIVQKQEEQNVEEEEKSAFESEPEYQFKT